MWQTRLLSHLSSQIWLGWLGDAWGKPISDTLRLVLFHHRRNSQMHLLSWSRAIGRSLRTSTLWSCCTVVGFTKGAIEYTDNQLNWGVPIVTFESRQANVFTKTPLLSENHSHQKRSSDILVTILTTAPTSKVSTQREIKMEAGSEISLSLGDRINFGKNLLFEQFRR